MVRGPLEVSIRDGMEVRIDIGGGVVLVGVATDTEMVFVGKGPDVAYPEPPGTTGRVYATASMKISVQRAEVNPDAVPERNWYEAIEFLESLGKGVAIEFTRNRNAAKD